MNKQQIKTLQQLNIVLDEKKSDIFEKYTRIFLEKNSRINLVSKKDQEFLFEKHVFDSLAINLFFSKQFTIHHSPFTLLDIGTGGGFPSIPAAILYDNLEVYAIDSIRKKIKVIEEIQSELGLKNLHPICDRVENIKEIFDFISARAVAPLKEILKYAIPKLKKGGYFIAYKSKNAQEEISDAQSIIKKSGIKLVKIINYTLPLEETFERNLVIFKK